MLAEASRLARAEIAETSDVSFQASSKHRENMLQEMKRASGLHIDADSIVAGDKGDKKGDKHEAEGFTSRLGQFYSIPATKFVVRAIMMALFILNYMMLLIELYTSSLWSCSNVAATLPSASALPSALLDS